MHKWIICLIVTCITHCGYAQVYDCFLFFNELEVLDIRLHELYDHVDKFVIVESVETFRGNPKPLLYQKNRRRYQKFSDKIIHVVLEERQETTNPWVREEYQRNQIMRGLGDCMPGDTIMISDVDEIVRGLVVPEIMRAVHNEKKNVVMCDQTMYRYYLNAVDTSTEWAGTCATTITYLNRVGPDKLRAGRNAFWNGEWRLLYPCIANAGWHFCSMGGLEMFTKKLESFSHQECDLSQNKTEKAIHQFMKRCSRIVPLDKTFPAYVLKNQKYFRDKGYLYEGELIRYP